jgi:dolichyl-diphosphooligosaccharide---protein glycosyltransferase
MSASVIMNTEEKLTGLPTVLKYGILGLICLLAFCIRLFAVVRYESVIHVAAWGGYVFIINVIPIYTLVLMVAGRFSSRLYIAYSCFYTMGSLMAMTVPFVGFNVVQQAECAGSHGVFVAVQVYVFIQFLHRVVGKAILRRLVMFGAGTVLIAVAAFLIVCQLQASIQWSGRSLTLLDPTYASKYIPIIASVSEHQPTTWTSFFFDLHVLVPLSPLGLAFPFSNPTDAAIFVILYGTLAWYFAGVMVRLMLTLAPIACILAAVGMSTLLNRFSAIIKVKAMDMIDGIMKPGRKVENTIRKTFSDLLNTQVYVVFGSLK